MVTGAWRELVNGLPFRCDNPLITCLSSNINNPPTQTTGKNYLQNPRPCFNKSTLLHCNKYVTECQLQMMLLECNANILAFIDPLLTYLLMRFRSTLKSILLTAPHQLFFTVQFPSSFLGYLPTLPNVHLSSSIHRSQALSLHLYEREKAVVFQSAVLISMSSFHVCALDSHAAVKCDCTAILDS